MNRWALPFFLAACVGAACTIAPGAEEKSNYSSPEALDLLVLAGTEPARLELRIEIDGRSVTKVWDEVFAKLLAFYDRDGSGSLDKTEAARLPQPLALRQVLWGQLSQPTIAPPWDDLDTDRDGKISGTELAGYYRRAGLGGALVGVGKPGATDKLTDALLAALDANKDGVVDATEWRAAPDVLRQLDKNDDELVGPGELIAGVAYPGTTGTRLLAAPKSGEKPDAITDALPLVVLPNQPVNTEWATAVADRRTPKLFPTATAGSLARLRTTAPLAVWTVRLGDRGPRPAVETRGEQPPASERLVLARGTLRAELRADAGKLDEQTSDARKRLLALFKEADLNADGALDEKELGVAKAGPFKLFLPSADRNEDGKLARPELGDWLELQEHIARAHVLVTVLDHGCGLFECLDTDHDGALSIRELRTSWDRLKATGCVTEKGLDRTKLPRQLLLAVSRGHPRTVIGKPVRPGPAWFVAMDRNGDGDVSRREFTGPAAVFEKLDLDKDGLLAPEEAKRADDKK